MPVKVGDLGGELLVVAGETRSASLLTDVVDDAASGRQVVASATSLSTDGLRSWSRNWSGR